MGYISTHVLDVATGTPAGEVPVRLEHQVNGEWHLLAELLTDTAGRARLLQTEHEIDKGEYRLSFDVAAYFARTKTTSLYPLVQITFVIRDTRNYHVPLLLSPFGYSTYRGS